MKKKLLATLAALALVLSVFPASVFAYDSTEISQLQNFLNQPSAVGGQTNADVLGYNVSDPSTWTEVTFFNDGTDDYVRFIDWSGEENLAGTLNVSGFHLLNTLVIQSGGGTNYLTSVDASNCPDLFYLDVSYNPLTSLSLTGSTDLSSFHCVGTQLSAINLSQSLGFSLNYAEILDNPMTSIQINLSGSDIVLNRVGNGTIGYRGGIETANFVEAYETSTSPFINWTDVNGVVSTATTYNLNEGESYTLTANFLAITPVSTTIYIGDTVTETANLKGGTWSYDSSVLSISAVDNVATFTGLKTGTTTVTYTIGEDSVSAQITVLEKSPATGDSVLPFVLGGLVLASGIVLLILIRKRISE